MKRARAIRLHPFHPMAVHAPIACILFTPLADAVALYWPGAQLWGIGALTAAGAAGFGLIAAMFGALDFERAHARAPRTALWHAILMAAAVCLAGVGLLGRVDNDFALATPAPWWAIGAGLAALFTMLAGAYLGGELVYGCGVGVRAPDEQAERT